MQKLVCQKPNEFVFQQSNRPVLKQGEALVRIKRIGICGTDLHAYTGNQPFFTYPRILGHELSGEIVEVAEKNDEFKVTDQVAINPYQECGKCLACRSGKTNCCECLEVRGVHRDGGMQEYVAIPVTHLIKTNDLDLDSAAIVECLSIGAHAVRRADIQKDETVLVIGAGPIGLGVMKFAKLQGAQVIAMDLNENRLAFSENWAEVDYIVKATEQSLEKIKAITNGDLPTIVFDATGNKQSMESSFNYAAFGGKVVFVSLIRDNLSFFYPDFHQKELTLLSSRNATQIDFEIVLQALRNGDVDTNSYVSHKIPFKQVVDQFETLLKPDTGIIKAMIEI